MSREERNEKDFGEFVLLN